VTKLSGRCPKCEERVQQEQRAAELAERQRREAEKRARREREEQERQAAIEELRSAIAGGMSFGGSTGALEENGRAPDFTISVVPGDRISLMLRVLNMSDKPIAGLAVRIENGDKLWADLPTSVCPNFPEAVERVAREKREFKLLTGNGLPVGRIVNPLKNAYYYRPDGWCWPTGAPPTDPDWYKSCSYSRLSRTASPGSDITMTMYVMVSRDVEVPLNSATVHVMHP